MGNAALRFYYALMIAVVSMHESPNKLHKRTVEWAIIPEVLHWSSFFA